MEASTRSIFKSTTLLTLRKPVQPDNRHDTSVYRKISSWSTDSSSKLHQHLGLRFTVYDAPFVLRANPIRGFIPLETDRHLFFYDFALYAITISPLLEATGLPGCRWTCKCQGRYPASSGQSTRAFSKLLCVGVQLDMSPHGPWISTASLRELVNLRSMPQATERAIQLSIALTFELAF
jgi:hypothetical protein